MPSLRQAVDQLRRIARSSTVSDAALLATFAVSRNESAFAELVRRHGPLVRGVCRRVLGGDPSADDAFQATFLLLARKAGRGGWQASVAGWLHVTAWNVARKARARIRFGPALGEREVSGPADPAVTAAWRELCHILDEELARLPDRLRSPLVLCYLDGHTRDEAAARLGWSLGTLKNRLEHGRALLRQRLERRGLTGGLLAAAIAPAAVPAEL
jgi:RNA polymerase sigma factor (sigma-70 family)